MASKASSNSRTARLAPDFFAFFPFFRFPDDVLRFCVVFRPEDAVPDVRGFRLEEVPPVFRFVELFGVFPLCEALSDSAEAFAMGFLAPQRSKNSSAIR